MKSDLPKCSRCCFCFPIRYGLLVWAYIKLLFGALLHVPFYDGLYLYMKYPENIDRAIDVVQDVVNGLLLSYSYLTTIFCIVAAHKKSVKLLGIYIRAETASIVANIVGILMNAIILGIDHKFYRFYPLLFYIAFIGTQVYVVLLVRSKINLMANKEEFKFTNTGAEAECTYHSGGTSNAVIENDIINSDRDKV